MDMQSEKQELMKLLKETKNPSVIKGIRNVFQKEKKDWWDELSVDQQNSLNESLEEYERGEFSSFDEFIKPYL